MVSEVSLPAQFTPARYSQVPRLFEALRKSDNDVWLDVPAILPLNETGEFDSSVSAWLTN